MVWNLYVCFDLICQTHCSRRNTHYIIPGFSIISISNISAFLIFYNYKFNSLHNHNIRQDDCNCRKMWHFYIILFFDNFTSGHTVMSVFCISVFRTLFCILWYYCALFCVFCEWAVPLSIRQHQIYYEFHVHLKWVSSKLFYVEL